MNRRHWALASLCTALPSLAVLGQTQLPRSITLIAPSVPGGSTDAVCRALAESLARRLGVTVTVENKAGTGGALGAMALAGARPDGSTLALLPLGVFRIALMQKVSFDPLRDIVYVAGLGGYVFGLAVPAAAPYRALSDLLAFARAHPGEVTYGHAGVGSTPHLAVEELAQKTGVQLTAVPYKGSNEALAALLAGQVSMMSGTTEFVPHVRDRHRARHRPGRRATPVGRVACRTRRARGQGDVRSPHAAADADERV